jgi:hypothetical protein
MIFQFSAGVKNRRIFLFQEKTASDNRRRHKFLNKAIDSQEIGNTQRTATA